MTRPTDTAGPDLDQEIGRALSGGAWLSVILLAVGVVGMAIHGIQPLSSPPPAFDPASLGSAIAGLEPVGFLGLGLVVVIATPVLRVALALAGYLRVGDRRMAAISLGILAILAASVVIGLSTEAAR
ncbi:MAG TPA: DUF1634 domain-containing protein [Candidatus Limnocylindrales bacterium]|jgi:uncharacterized membrane protein